MKYIFFDIECCDGTNICEFGYVVTDDSYKIIKKDFITMNPNAPFNLTGRNGQADIELYFTEEYYKMSPSFPHFYKDIKDLLSDKDSIKIVHSGGNDSKFLRTACDRYALEKINFTYIDSQKLSRKYHGEYGNISTEKAIEKYNLKPPVFLHRSDEDAYLICQMTQKICQEQEVPLLDIAKDRTICGKSLELSKHERKKEIEEFSGRVKKEGKLISNELTNKVLCISEHYEAEYMKETMVIIQQLANCGCKYNHKLSDCQYFVDVNVDWRNSINEKDDQYGYAKSARKKGKIKIITMDELLAILEISEDELDVKKETIKSEKKREYITEMTKPTLGDLLSLKLNEKA